MNGIQILLILMVSFIGIYFFVRLRNYMIDVVLLCMFVVTAVVLILMPEITNTFAKALNVGRGADLIFYISTMLFWYIILKLYARLRKLEKTVTQIVRNYSLKTAAENEATIINDAQQS
ncbi:MAG TPA: DUF2304 domain-containing protein [Allocoleopsis sp.]